MGVGVATTDAFRNVIVHPGHYYIGADSADSHIQLVAGKGLAVDVNVADKEIIFHNKNCLECLSREEILNIESPETGKIVAVKENQTIAALAVFNGLSWCRVNFDSTL